MESKENNTLSGFHIRKNDGVTLKVQPKKYTWHIPKKLRSLNIQSGDIVAVGKSRAPFLVVEVFREEFEETGKSYKRVEGIYERANRE